MPEFTPNENSSSQNHVLALLPAGLSYTKFCTVEKGIRLLLFRFMHMAYCIPLLADSTGRTILSGRASDVVIDGIGSPHTYHRERVWEEGVLLEGTVPLQKKVSQHHLQKEGCHTMSSAECCGGEDPRLRKWPQLHKKPLLYWPVSITNPPRSLRPVLSRRASRASLSVTL